MACRNTIKFWGKFPVIFRSGQQNGSAVINRCGNGRCCRSCVVGFWQGAAPPGDCGAGDGAVHFPPPKRFRDTDLKALYAYLRHLGPRGEPAPAYAAPGTTVATPFYVFVQRPADPRFEEYK